MEERAILMTSNSNDTQPPTTFKLMYSNIIKLHLNQFKAITQTIKLASTSRVITYGRKKKRIDFRQILTHIISSAST